MSSRDLGARSTLEIPVEEDWIKNVPSANTFLSGGVFLIEAHELFADSKMRLVCHRPLTSVLRQCAAESRRSRMWATPICYAGTDISAGRPSERNHVKQCISSLRNSYCCALKRSSVRGLRSRTDELQLSRSKFCALDVAYFLCRSHGATFNAQDLGHAGRGS